MKPTTVDEYLAQYSGVARQQLERVREIIFATIPDAEERLSYGMPAYFLHGKVVIYFGGHAQHVGVYPGRVAKGDLAALLKGYLSGASTAKFAYDTPLPEELIVKLVQFRANEVMLIRMEQPYGNSAKDNAKSLV